MDESTLLFLAPLIKLFFVTFLIGWLPALIAKSKGRGFFLWWIYGGGLFIVALIHALLLKEKGDNSKERNEQLQAKADQLGTPVYQCNLCKEMFSESEESLSHIQAKHGMREREARSHIRWAAPLDEAEVVAVIEDVKRREEKAEAERSRAKEEQQRKEQAEAIKAEQKLQRMEQSKKELARLNYPRNLRICNVCGDLFKISLRHWHNENTCPKCFG